MWFSMAMSILKDQKLTRYYSFLLISVISYSFIALPNLDLDFSVFMHLTINKLVLHFQEYCIRHIDGSPVKSDAERQRVIQCLEAAIERRVSEVSPLINF